MAQYRATVRTSKVINQIRLEKGMSVVFMYDGGSPLSFQKGKEAINDAFIRTYGIDISKVPSMLSNITLEVTKIG
ncbi:hypothetical protein KRX57_01330 [Weeksellaceae bacterium TAE3-ERU29]|nr:hypothetical protein [Weeksellaceae bacterium TAE3-ERU29]